ncbi:predicted protein [Nematostella vectensis]|uniref:G-protein coupled receptors family 1 profile domain-containing protein n=1 Tax=Nematostella vectensis TaxID=45351 RepID=A7TDI1_NEMVE|nr:predicted protein [Nematostella vectensis]|eukprot:XP_001617961.1 hypothetical protein NEMVEDRAFT_v1g225636 [Nematostella vectensis]
MNMSSSDERFNALQENSLSRGTARVVIESLVVIILCLIGLIGNILVLRIVKNKRSEGKMIYLFIGALALTDVSLLATYPFFAFPVMVLGKWPFSDFVCQSYGFCILFLVSASLLLMALTAINRYFQVVRTKYYRRLFTPSRTKFFIGVALVLACIVPVPYLASGEKYIFIPGKNYCFQKPNTKIASMCVYLNGSCVMLVLTACYIKIFKTIRNHQARVTSIQQNTDSISGPSVQDIKVTRTLFLTVMGFVFCWTPVIVIDIIDMTRGLFSLPRELYYLHSFMGTLSSIPTRCSWSLYWAHLFNLYILGSELLLFLPPLQAQLL